MFTITSCMSAVRALRACRGEAYEVESAEEPLEEVERTFDRETAE